MEYQLPLARQLDLVFREISKELSSLNSGVVFVQIRNNMIGKFGVRHEPMQAGKASNKTLPWNQGLSEQHQYAFRKMAIRSLDHKKNWTHGEMEFDFVVRDGTLHTSVHLESNYNMAQVLQQKKHV